MAKVYIIHGWGGNPNEPLHKWISEKLTEKGYEVIVPEMPETYTPKIDLWLDKIKETAQNIQDENDFFIGHDIGCQTILRFLSKMPQNVKVQKIILLAPWIRLDKEKLEKEGSSDISRPWEESPINYKSVKEHCNNFICIFSNNDPYVPLSNVEFFRKNLNAKTIMLKGRGHFDSERGITELPEILNLL